MARFRRTIRSGTTAADSDTGAQFAEKINENFRELYDAVEGLPVPAIPLEMIEQIFDEKVGDTNGSN